MESDHLKPGDLVAGEYRVERMIGSGGFARVFRAVQERLDRRVAAKVLRPRDDADETPSKRAADRFQREAQLVSKLQSPHTVTLYDYGRLGDGRFYMIMEYVDGVTLSELVNEQGPVSPERLVDIWKQLLDSLREAHTVGIIHRDIKPDNVMIYDRIGHRDAVKLLDFGVAKSVANEQRADRGLTQEGAVIGTPKYMSPEQLLGRPLTPASDLFSLGMLGFLLYDGGVPYQSTRPAAILERMKQFDRDLGAFEGAPEPVSRVARRLLAPDLEDRYESAAEALADLEDPSEREAAVRTAARAGTESGATFPMGFDREGGTESTELTGAGDLRVATGTTAGPSRDEAPSSEVSDSDEPGDLHDSETAILPEREETSAPESKGPGETPASTRDIEDEPEKENRGGRVAPFAFGLAFGLVVVVGGWMFFRADREADRPDEPRSEAIASGMDDESDTVREESSGAPAPRAELAVEAASRVVRTALAASEMAVRRNDSGASGSRTDRADRDESERRERPDPEAAPEAEAEQPGTAAQGTPEAGRESSDGDGKSSDGVEPLDENEDDPSEEPSSSEDFEVEAWE